jgi:PucR C-terminal helix-turn-helix domain/GGDEF-like domain
VNLERPPDVMSDAEALASRSHASNGSGGHALLIGDRLTARPDPAAAGPLPREGGSAVYGPGRRDRHRRWADSGTDGALSVSGQVHPSVSERISDVFGALTPRVAEVTADICRLILREIPELRGDERMLGLLEASVGENVATLAHVLQHGIELEQVRAPAAAEAYARRLAQRGIPVAALLRAHRIGSARWQEWWLRELGRRPGDAAAASAAALRISQITARYVDRICEEIASCHGRERENWLPNRGAALAAQVRALLGSKHVDIDAAEAILGYRLRQHHVGVVCWADSAGPGGRALRRLEQATADRAATADCQGRPVFVPQDESCAWAWLPLGARDRFAAGPASSAAGGQTGIRFAFGAVAAGVAGFRRTHQQALGAHAVALAAGSSGQFETSFADVAPLTMMSGSAELLRAWVIEVLGALADDDGHNARLRDTLRVFLQENGSYRATAQRLTLHKNTVQYRVRKAEQRLGRPIGADRLQVELALLAAQWLGGTVLRQGEAAGRGGFLAKALEEA